MGSLTDVLKFVEDLQIVAKGDGFDVTLSDSQVERLKNNLRGAVMSPTTGKKSLVRVTNMRKVLLPVAVELSWPYLAMGIGAGVLGGIWLAKFVK